MAVVDINTCMIKVHRCMPVELLLGFNPVAFMFNENFRRGWMVREEKLEDILYEEIWNIIVYWVTT
jgi:hypothetical protein